MFSLMVLFIGAASGWTWNAADVGPELWLNCRARTPLARLSSSLDSLPGWDPKGARMVRGTHSLATMQQLVHVHSSVVCQELLSICLFYSQVNLTIVYQRKFKFPL